MLRLLLGLFLSFSATAGIENLKIVNLNLNYVAPNGTGDVENINFGFSTPGFVSYPLEMDKTEDSFNLRTPFIDISWYNPWKMLHTTESLRVKGLNVKAGKFLHEASATDLKMQAPGLGKIGMEELRAACRGESMDSKLQNRLLQDCLGQMLITVDHLDLPIDFFFSEDIRKLPRQTQFAEKPADNLTFSLKKGEAYLEVFTRVVFYAGIRVWGNVTLENNNSTIAIRIDKAKFGVIGITRILLSNIRKMARPPYVTVEGNVIKININFK